MRPWKKNGLPLLAINNKMITTIITGDSKSSVINAMLISISLFMNKEYKV